METNSKNLDITGAGRKRKYNEVTNKITSNKSKNVNQILNDGDNFNKKKTYENFTSNNNSNYSNPKYHNEHEITYGENELMTFFENFWILRQNLEKMKNLSDQNKSKIIEKRENDNKDSNLTLEEKSLYNTMMKSEKKNQIKLLKSKLLEMKNKNKDTATINRSLKLKKPGKYLGINFDDNEDLVKVNGIFIKKDGYERIMKLEEKLRANGTTEEDIVKVVKYQRRKEERRMKKELKQKSGPSQPPNNSQTVSNSNQNEEKLNGVSVCFKCNSSDHFARNCPENKNNSVSNLTCFKCNNVGHISRNCPSLGDAFNNNNNQKYCDECGSDEHLFRNCPKRETTKGASFTCYKCKEVGHIARDCPSLEKALNNDENIKKCSECGSENHKKRNCPKKQK